MTLNDLFLNTRNTSLQQIIHQTAVQTEQDKEEYTKTGYQIPFTEAEFRAEFPSVDPQHICYTPSISLPCFYFNKSTLAVAPFHIGLLQLNTQTVVTIEDTCRVIAEAEAEAARKDFTSGIRVLPDRMRMEYLQRIIARYGRSVEGLYELFMDVYNESDFGCNELGRATLETVVAAKTEADKQRTAAAIAEDERCQCVPFITVYRGGNSESAHYTEAYSWTLDINVANFFACRLGNGPGYIAIGRIKKEDIIEVLDERGEAEVLVPPQRVHISQVVRIPGIDYLGTVLPEVAFTYHHYRDKLEQIVFARESEAHGKGHCARVLLLTQIIAHRFSLSNADRKILAEAAIHHDCQRFHDDEDTEHGSEAAVYYEQNAAVPNHLVSFLCKYHCKPDEEGWKAVAQDPLLNADMPRAKRLLDIFKDADALDRVRFGIKALDVNQLRSAYTRDLTLVAKLNHENLKVNT